MKTETLNRLQEVLGIHTYFGQEEKMAEYLKRVLTAKGYSFEEDIITSSRGSTHHNIYVTKGESEAYPCFVSHIDTVHRIDESMIVIKDIRKDKLILTGINENTGKPSGIGGDDKCGVFICLEMLDRLDNVKVAFFGGEEFGMMGSKQLRKEFFDDVGYAIQYDSPQGNSMSMSLCSTDLFNKDSEFGEIVKGPILEHGIDQWCRHPYTDAYQIIAQTDVSCLNLAAGYHNYHRPDEYVVVSEVQNGIDLGLKLVGLLGEVRYERDKSQDPVYRTY